jgi:hypothetical protein
MAPGQMRIPMKQHPVFICLKCLSAYIMRVLKNSITVIASEAKQSLCLLIGKRLLRDFVPRNDDERIFFNTLIINK